MITLNLKAKHMLLVADNLFDVVANESFGTLQKIKDSVTGAADDDIVPIVIEWEKVFAAWLVMTTKTSGEYKDVNNEMEALLMPQVQKGVQEKNQEWIDFATELTKLKMQQASVVPAKIEQAKKRLFN